MSEETSIPSLAGHQTRPWPSPVYAWYTVGVLTFAYTVSFVDRQILSLLVVPIQNDLGLSDTQLGLLQGVAFGIFYTLMGLPLGRLADAYNRRRIICIGVTLWTTATALCGLAQSFWQLFLARIGVGVGEASLSPSALSLISDYFPPQKRSFAVSVYFSGAILGGGIALIAGGAAIELIEATNFSTVPFLRSFRPWQLTFFLVALPGVVVIALMLSVMEPVRRELLGNTTTPGVPLSTVIRHLTSHWRAYICLNVGFAIYTLLAYGLAAWVPTYFIRSFSWTPGEVGLKYGFVVLTVGTVGIIFGGWLAGWLERKGHADAPYRVMMFAILGLWPFAVLAPLTQTATMSIGLFSFVSFFMAMPTGVGFASLQKITPNQMRAQVTALFLFSSNIIGLSLGPSAVAFFTDYVFGDIYLIGRSIALLSFSIIPLSLAVLWLGLRAYGRTLANSNEWASKGS